MTETQQMVKKFLNKCGIIFEDYKMLDGMLIPRETLLNNEKYKNIKEDLVQIKKTYSSGSLTALQKCAEKNWESHLLIPAGQAFPPLYASYRNPFDHL